MSDFDVWRDKRFRSSKSPPISAEESFCAGAAAQIEKDAARAETFVHDDWGKLMLECGKDIAAAIRAQLTQQET